MKSLYALLTACIFFACARSAQESVGPGSHPVEGSVNSVSQPVDAGQRSAHGVPVIFVVGANALYSFDVDGNSLQTVQLDPERGMLNGGITVAMDKLYVTYVKNPAYGEGGGVVAFNARTLRPVMLHFGAFTVPDAATNPGLLLAIAYDAHNERFYVLSERLGLLAFDRAGKFIPRKSPSMTPLSAIAYDAARQALWVVSNRHVVQLSEDGSSPLLALPAAGASYKHGASPLAVAYCGAGAEGASSMNAIAVAFGKANAGRDVAGAVQAYDIVGKPIGAPVAGEIVSPHGIACSSRGEVFIAADNGLLEYSLQDAKLRPAGQFQGLRAPLYGVFVAY